MKLHFLSLVEVARIPLYLAAGPCCDVSTTSQTTTRWLNANLLDYEEAELHGDVSRGPWWSHPGMQSENGILLSVVDGDEKKHGIWSAVTEMLLYAAVTYTGPAQPISPASSSPAPAVKDLKDAPDQSGKIIKVFALPLCSNVISLANEQLKTCPPTPTDPQSALQAYFLPYTHDSLEATQVASQKRQSISTLFEDATQKRRKLKGRGGESISQAMAGIDCLHSQQAPREKQEAPQLQQNDLRRKSLSRAPSMTAVAGPGHSRPTSRSEPRADGKRSSLHRVESIMSPRDSPTLIDADGSYAQQNKAALTKVVMAAMRLHGLQQKKRPQTKSEQPSQVTLHTTTGVIVNEVEDEYKLVYHQTFKAATFTFRKHLNAYLISQDTMRDIVDRLLTMFCTDPMMVEHATNHGGFPDPEFSDGLPSSSPFDKPSSQARSSHMTNGWNTPTVKKR